MSRSSEVTAGVSEEEKKWLAIMMKSAKKYHKLCPYFDKKTAQCLLMATIEDKIGKCDRDGRYDRCPILIKFLEKLYRYHVEKGKVLPRDFQDVVNQTFIL